MQLIIIQGFCFCCAKTMLANICSPPNASICPSLNHSDFLLCLKQCLFKRYCVLLFCLRSVQSSFKHFFPESLVFCSKMASIFQSDQVSMCVLIPFCLIAISESLFIDFNGIWIKFICSITYICLLSWNKPALRAAASRELGRTKE